MELQYSSRGRMREVASNVDSSVVIYGLISRIVCSVRLMYFDNFNNIKYIRITNAIHISVQFNDLIYETHLTK